MKRSTVTLVPVTVPGAVTLPKEAVPFIADLKVNELVQFASEDKIKKIISDNFCLT